MSPPPRDDLAICSMHRRPQRRFLRSAKEPRDVVVGGPGRRRRPHGGVLPRFSVAGRAAQVKSS